MSKAVDKEKEVLKDKEKEAEKVVDEPIEKDKEKLDLSLEELIEKHGLTDEYSKVLQSATDKRVTEAIKTKEAEFQKQLEREKMSEEERRQAEAKEREAEISRRLKEATIKELKYNLVDVITKNDLDIRLKDTIDVSTLLTIDNEDERLAKLEEKVKLTSQILEDIANSKVEEFKQEYLKGVSPNVRGKVDPSTVANDYEKAKKQGDTKTMLAEKFKAKGIFK